MALPKCRHFKQSSVAGVSGNRNRRLPKMQHVRYRESKQGITGNRGRIAPGTGAGFGVGVPGVGTGSPSVRGAKLLDCRRMNFLLLTDYKLQQRNDIVLLPL
jgi:hypothetical protein